jgi:hypothetical protein
MLNAEAYDGFWGALTIGPTFRFGSEAGGSVNQQLSAISSPSRPAA